jgi:hypothetical protein
LVHCGEFGAKNAQALSGDAIGAAALLGWKGFDPSLLFEAGDCPIEGSGAQARAAKPDDVFDHGVAVLRSATEAGKYEERRIGIVARFRVVFVVYYVLRTTHDVVIAQ